MTDTIEQIVAEHTEEEAARIAATEKDVVIAGDSNRDWAVISMCGLHRFHDSCPCVIYGGLETREAAEVARQDAMIGLLDATHRQPYGPSEVPKKYFNAVGRVLAKLRSEGIQHDDLLRLASDLVVVAEHIQWANRPNDDERPFG